MNSIPSAIIGSKSQSGSGERSVIFNPATGEPIGSFLDADPALVDAATKAAKTCFDSGIWSKASVADRQAQMRKIADVIEANVDGLSLLETQNTGIVRRSVRGFHIGRAAYNFRFFADYIGQTKDALYDQDPNFLTLVRRAPIGVAALIAPWNAPLALGSMKIAAAIAFGNSCVIKPSEQAPLGIIALVELLAEAGLPDNVVNLVNGRGHTTGDALVRHPDVDVVSFTGGTSTGKHIMSVAGAGLKPATMELGGKSANVIFADADLNRALDGALLGIYANTGQQCLAGSRILVQESIADDFIAAFVKRAENIRIGDPMDDATEMGPLASAPHRERVLSFIDKGLAEQAELLTGGDVPDGLDKGYYINPIAMRAKSNNTMLCQEEIFGPFATFLTFKDDEEAYALANGTNFGLVSYVWSQHIDRILEAQDRLHSGVVWINTPMMRELRAPFGGYGASGVGAEGGDACQALYTREKTITTPRKPLPLEKWGA